MEEEDEQEKDFVFQQIGNLLASSHELSFNILRRLCYKDLISTSQVCQMWERISRSIIKKERRFRYSVFHPQWLPTTVSKGSSSNRLDTKMAFESFLQQEKFKDMEGCLVFSNGEWLYREDIRASLGAKGSTLSSVMTRLLPSTCQLGLICALGVVGTLEHRQPKLLEDKSKLSHSSSSSKMDKGQNSYKLGLRNLPDSSGGGSSSKMHNEESNFNGSTLEQPVGYSIEIEEGIGSDSAADGESCNDPISIIFFPRQPGLKIKASFIEGDKIFKRYHPNRRNISISESEFNSYCSLSASDDLKAFLLFYSEHNAFTEALASAAVCRENGDVAFGGGLVRAVQQKSDCLNGVLTISFSGCNVKANSIVIPPNVKNEKLLLHYLNKLKKDHLPDTQSMCFLFACCGRGQLWYQRSREDIDGRFSCFEAKAFRKLFPNVPLLGFFGEGEAGRNFIPANDSTDETPRKKRKRQLFHQFTSIFVLVSIL